ncbi:MAG: UDP-2,3-diacylglucosamine diphosphatase [Rubrivivax sp.]
MATATDLPAFYEWRTEPDWRAVEFISDLHLSDALPRTFDAFAAHLRHSNADAILILGDLFEAWVGDDMRGLPFERRCVEVLGDAASRRCMAFMHGNRDFLVGSAMLRDCGLRAVPDPTVLDAWGQRILLTHGDALCLDDLPYQRFRSEVRADAWQAAFMARPLSERLQIAAGMRQQSAAHQQLDGNPDIDVDAAEAVRWMHAMGAAEMVHGHTHRPGSNLLAPGHKRHVLSDWDLDYGSRAQVLRLTRAGFERSAPVTAAATV